MGNASFPGGKVRPGRDADPSRTSSAEVKNRVELYSTLPKGLCGLWKGETQLNKTTIKRNILTNKQNTSGSRSG